MKKKGLIKGILTLSIMGIGFVTSVKLDIFPHANDYVGSDSCVSCHENDHGAWSDSMHPRMMQKVSDQSVVADLESPNILFEPSDARWTIGSKWEQQFMGHEDGKDTLLPGRWMVSGQNWDQKNWDGIEAPEPLRRCHGCHTVGLNVDDGTFVEPSIGCESCHGSGGWHVKTRGLGKIINSVSAEVCGQCHSRGRTEDQKYYFPVNYTPGDDLPENFKLDRPDFLQNSSNWWGNGSERRRHQEYIAWSREGHANSLKSLREDYDDRFGKVTEECLSCHEAEHAIDSTNAKSKFSTATEGITCSVCHNVHGELDEIRISCDQCHTNGALHHTETISKPHIPCPDEAEVGCVNCHMPLTVKNGGGFTLHSHAPNIVTPEETIKFGVPNSCQNGGCHADISPETMQEMYQNQAYSK